MWNTCKKSCKENFPNLKILEIIGLFFLAGLGVFFIFIVSWFLLGEKVETLFATIFSNPIQIDPLNFLGTFIVGVLTLLLFKKQNEIAQLSLESNAPNLIIKESFYNKDSENMTPYLEISNSEQLSLSDLHVFYMVSADDKSKKLGVFEDKTFQGIEIFKNQAFRIPLEGSSAKLYHSVIFVYTNPISKKIYTYGININFLEKNSIFPLGVDYPKSHFNNLESPFLLKSYKRFLQRLPKNLENIKEILKEEYLKKADEV